MTSEVPHNSIIVILLIITIIEYFLLSHSLFYIFRSCQQFCMGYNIPIFFIGSLKLIELSILKMAKSELESIFLQIYILRLPSYDEAKKKIEVKLITRAIEGYLIRKKEICDGL